MLPLVLKGSAEQMSVFYVLSWVGAPNCTSAWALTQGQSWSLSPAAWAEQPGR